jgi:two-component system, NtrC family, response regulator AtoC
LARILVVDDEEGIRAFVGEVLEDQGHAVTRAADGVEAAELLAKRAFHLMITDLKMPRMDGMTLLRKARAGQPEMEVIVLTAHGTVESAVEAMKLGAYDYLTKPLSSPAELRLLAERALERRRLRDAAARSRSAGGEEPDFVAVDPASQRLVEQLRRVAATDATVLLTGESGTGKEVAARALHRWSRRADGPFVAVNCAAMSETLLESEMFGHEKGAFTGATERRRGRLELAEGGTLFLDEIGEMNPALQAKLLRVLQDGRFERVGGTRTIESDVRWVAATNRDLPEEIRGGRFREDLFHRLSVFPLRLLPLRERRADIRPLAEHLMGVVAARVGRPGLGVDEAALACLEAATWTGNVRELGNVLERAAILCDGPTIRPEHLMLDLAGGGLPTATAEPRSLQDIERDAIAAALRAEGGNRKRAAARLGIGVRTVYDKIKQYGL